MRISPKFSIMNYVLDIKCVDEILEPIQGWDFLFKFQINKSCLESRL